MRCDFCGTNKMTVTKYKCTGTNNDKKVSKTIKICICCDAQTDNDWLAEQLGWDKTNEVETV